MTPLLLINLNLLPTIQTHLDHLLCLGLALGSHALKDINLFFHPAYLKLQELAWGINTTDVSQDKWKKIGILTIKSSFIIPGSFTQAFPNIYKEKHLYIAEMYAFWMMYLASILLKGCWATDTDKYYKHAVLLSSILRCIVKYKIPV